MSHGHPIPDKILGALRLRPKGMTITNIAKQIGATRSSVSKHLEILHIGGKVDVSIIGNAKLYSLAQRVPISDFLCFTKSLILVLDSAHQITQVNDQFLDHFQINKDDLIDVHILDAGIPIISTQETLDIIEATKTERVVNEFSLVENQEEFFYTMEVIRTRFEYGGAGVTIVLDNITGRKRAELAVRESETFKSRIIEAMPDELFIVGGDGRIIDVMVSDEHLLIEPKEDVITKTAYDYLTEEDAERMRQAIKQTLASRNMVTIEYALSTPGGIRHFEARLVFYREDQVLGIVRDVTEKKAAEDAVRESEERYRNVVMHQTEFICRFLPDGTHLFVNEAYCRRFNKTEEELIGTRFKPVIHPDDREKVTRLFAQLTPDNHTGWIDQRIILQDHDIVWDRWITRAFFHDDGSVREYQSVGRDITVKKNAEVQLRISEGRFRNVTLLQNSDHQVFPEFFGTWEKIPMQQPK